MLYGFLIQDKIIHIGFALPERTTFLHFYPEKVDKPVINGPRLHLNLLPVHFTSPAHTYSSGKKLRIAIILNFSVLHQFVGKCLMTISQHVGSLQIEHIFLIDTDVEIVPEMQLFFDGERGGNQRDGKDKLNGNQHITEVLSFSGE